MNSSLVESAKHYLWGLFAACFNGAISSVATVGTLAAMSASGVADIHTLNLREAGSVFVGSFILHGIMWLNAHRLPASIGTSTPFNPPNP